MDFDLGPAATALRGQLRELVSAHMPPDFLGAFTDDPADLEAAQQFCRLLAERGLLCMSWPEEFGGRASSVWEQTVVREEMWAHHEPRGAQYMGVNWVGPILMRHGTPEQQRKHLPPIAAGEVIWCQGFSEPEAGSDLASLRTLARRDPEDPGGWLVNGQKIWTSYATMAQWCFLLARTSRIGEGETRKKQQGLTIFLVPMDDPAIQVRPIRTMLGPHHLNEVFFDDLRVTDADVLGEVGQGWSIVADVMSFERTGIARYARCERLLMAAPSVLGEHWDRLPAELRGRWTRMLTHCRRARLMAYRVVELQNAGQVKPGDAAAYRIAVTRLDQDSAEVLTEIVAGLPEDGETPPDAVMDRAHFRAEVEDHWRYSQASTVSSGSIEMQRILLSRALLAEGR
ncbi:acyl-CoA dehydrogenase family protein [Mycolicibacterium palauense]|uniref:acyl-CoA dehydrogenase family protein n=1 Tax=Mycolicibacterium palauense TaxID=2034511 RepID=UPI000BFF16C0|nr:acyl-CoA dehydrogenase family protein [Mycolicibacterium palauense]